MPHRAAIGAPSWPLIGRDAELERIAVARRQDGCSGVVVRAPAGLGKSRLAREASAAAAAEGLPAIWVQATRSASAIPLGAFADLIPDDVRSDDALELLRRSGDALRERARDRRVVLGVDDAQLLDPISAALVLHLATTSTAFVLATVRSGEPVPDAIQSLWKDAGASRLELRRLSDETVAALVESGLGGPVERHAIEWVIASSQGNALYVRELVLGALEAGTLRRDGDLWRLAGRPPVSATLRELVTERMASLPASELAPVELLALVEPLRIDELTTLAGLEASINAEALGLIAIDAPADEVRLAHPLYGDTLRADLPGAACPAAAAAAGRDAAAARPAHARDGDARRAAADRRPAARPARAPDRRGARRHACRRPGPGRPTRRAGVARRRRVGRGAAAGARAHDPQAPRGRPRGARRRRAARRRPRCRATTSSSACSRSTGACATSSRRARSSRRPGSGRTAARGRTAWSR